MDGKPLKKSSRAAQVTTSRLGLRPLPLVTRMWNEQSGESISRARVWQILQKAERKIAAALAGKGT